VRAIAIRIYPPTPTRFKFICVLDPMTGVENGGTIVVYDNSLPGQRGFISNIDDRKVDCWLLIVVVCLPSDNFGD